MVIAESVVIEREIVPVYEAFADVLRWKTILADVLDVQLLYFDGYHQEFTMTVDRPTGAETVRGIRFCRPCRELEIFQPQPPPGLKKMAGIWTFDEDPRGTTVVATRHFALNGGEQSSPNGADQRERAFADKLRQILKTNLGLFKEAIEHDGPNRN